jgi:transketolase C-terminal domain/subunit
MVQELSAEVLGLAVLKLGFPPVYVISGPYESLLAHYGLDAAGLASAITQAVERPRWPGAAGLTAAP